MELPHLTGSSDDVMQVSQPERQTVRHIVDHYRHLFVTSLSANFSSRSRNSFSAPAIVTIKLA